MNPENDHTSADPAKSPSARSRIVNWIVVLTIVAILAAIIVSTTGRVSECGGRSVASSNLRQVGQASLIYASDSQDQLPQVDDIHAFAFELARLGGLNDATIWITGTDDSTGLSTVLSSDRKTLHPTFAAIRPSLAAAVRSLKINLPSTTPIAWTRGLQPDGTWSKDSPYGGQGGHIVFLGGDVAWFRNTTNVFIDREGRQATDIRAALPPDAVIANN